MASEDLPPLSFFLLPRMVLTAPLLPLLCPPVLLAQCS
jgi:hypothetical protein